MMRSRAPCFAPAVPFRIPRRRAAAVTARRPHASLAEAQDADYHQETFRVSASECGLRIDKLLATRFNERSRTYIQELLSTGNVELGGRTPSKSQRAAEGEVVAVRFLPTQRDLPLEPEDIGLDVLYEDEHVVFINKPAGMVVHPAPGHWTGTLVHALTYHYASIRRLGGPRPGVVHRLDKGTSGVVVAAKTATAQARLCGLFAARGVTKEYVAVTVGNPAGAGCRRATIDAAVGRAANDRLRMAVVGEAEGGKAARSVVEVVGADAGGLLHCVRVGIETGRTHQIRVHLRHARAPVLGDDLYGAGDVNRRFRTAAGRPLLHARRLRLTHPVTGAPLDVAAPLADDIGRVLERTVLPGWRARTGW